MRLETRTMQVSSYHAWAVVSVVAVRRRFLVAVLRLHSAVAVVGRATVDQGVAKHRQRHAEHRIHLFFAAHATISTKTKGIERQTGRRKQKK